MLVVVLELLLLELLLLLPVGDVVGGGWVRAAGQMTSKTLGHRPAGRKTRHTTRAWSERAALRAALKAEGGTQGPQRPRLSTS